MTSRSRLDVLKLERLLADRFRALHGRFGLLIGRSAIFALREDLLDVVVVVLSSEVGKDVFGIPVEPVEVHSAQLQDPKGFYDRLR